MGFYTDNIVAPGTKIYALVELDDYNTTHSTGGIVVKIYWVLPYPEDASNPVNVNTPWKDYPGWDSSRFKTVEITNSNEEVHIGWILQDKTGVLRDPNS